MQPEKAVCQINSWVAAATNNLIDSILAPASLEKNTSLVLANAIYFKGKWEEPFDKADTVVDKFYRLDGIAAAGARFMRSRSSQFISVRDGLKVLKLPYESAPPLRPWPGTGSGRLAQRDGCWPASLAVLHVRLPAGHARRPAGPRRQDHLHAGVLAPPPAGDAGARPRVQAAQVQAVLLR